MAKGTLQIDLLGTSFVIQSDETSEYLTSVYNQYKRTIKQIEAKSGITDQLKIAIIAGILLTDELYKEKTKHTDQSTVMELVEAEKIALNMISRIDKVIDK